MGGVHRPTRSKDLPRTICLTDQERDDLVAFLGTLSSEEPPQPSREAWVGNLAPTSPPPPPESTNRDRAGVGSAAKLTFDPDRSRGAVKMPPIAVTCCRLPPDGCAGNI